MRILSRSTIADFWMKNPDSEQGLKAWFKEAEHAQWKSFFDIKAQYKDVDQITGNRVVFNICYNRFRLVVQIHYNTGVIYIRFVGTHKEYSRVNQKLKDL